MYGQYTCHITSQSVRKWLSYGPNASKMFINKILELIFFLPKNASKKYENISIELSVKFCIERKLLMAKITALKSSLFAGISHNHVLTFNPRPCRGVDVTPPP